MSTDEIHESRRSRAGRGGPELRRRGAGLCANAWLCLAVAGCFGGDFVQGLPCKSDAECGAHASCIDGYCGGLGDPALCGNGLRDVGEDCDDGNVDDGDDCTASCLLPLAAPGLELSPGPIKQFKFSWEPGLGAEYYRLFERANPTSGFERIGGDIAAESSALTVPLHLRGAASYRLDACNALRCAESEVVAVVGGLAEAVGYFKASNTNLADRFGWSVALSGDGNTMAVGALGESSGATEIDGDQDDDTAAEAGAVYVFARTGESWAQQGYLKASNAGAGDQFGASVALSGDGDSLVVGAPGEDSVATGIDGDQGADTAMDVGAVYVFVRDGEDWSQQSYVKATNAGFKDQFGASVSLSGQGKIFAVGAPMEKSKATDVDGDQTNNEVFNSGAVYVFAVDGESWAQQAYVKASNTGQDDYFGASVALSSSGDTLAVGAPGEDSNATEIDGDQIDESTRERGAVYVFTRSGEIWSQQAYAKAARAGMYDYFGTRVALSGDGDTLAVGADQENSGATGIDGDQGEELAEGAGAVYVFGRSGGSWSRQAYVKASNTGQGDRFGGSIALSGDGKILAVGAMFEGGGATGIDGDPSDDSAKGAGAVYTYERTGETWSTYSYVKAPRTIASDQFGCSVALSDDGTALAVGAIGENFGTTGVGNESGIAAFNAGAVYLY